MDVRSRPGEGTVVSLWLPAAEAPAELVPLDDPGPVPDTARRGLALLVEDDAEVRKVVRRSLLDLGYAVIEAGHGQEALDILRWAPQQASEPVAKVIASAAANAQNNNGLDPATLVVATLYADEGPTAKRIRPRAQGRAYRIRKRTSHITVVVGE